MSEPTLTIKEEKAIKRIQKAFENFPKTLWLFSGGQEGIAIVKKKDGQQVMEQFGGFDTDYIVGNIKGVLSEGGDW